MSGPRVTAAVVAGVLAGLVFAPAECGVSEHYEPALHVEFDAVPDELLSFAKTQLSASKSQKVCKTAVELLQQSSSPFLHDVAQALAGKSATLEPSFGCGMLALGPTKDSRARFWTVRVRLPLLLRWRFIEKTLKGLKDLPGIHAVAPVPRAIPAQADDTQQVGTPPTTDGPPDGLDPYVGYPTYDEPSWAPVGTQWYLHECGVLDAWRMAWPPSDPATAPVVAMVDFGFWTDHPELQNLRKDLARNTCDDSTDVSWGSKVPHGTGAAGLLGAMKDDNGIMGVAYGAEIWPLQGTCEKPTTNDAASEEDASGDAWAKAVDWVTEAEIGERRKIVVLTVQTSDERNYESNLALRHAIARAAEKNVVVVLAAGNGDKDVARDIKGNDIPETAAILVGATLQDPPRTRWEESNYGTRIVVSAPGDPEMDVTLSTDPSDPYCRQFGGTSGAAPKVAGVVAMMLNANQDLTPAQVKDILRGVGVPVTSDVDKPVGHFLDAKAAVEEAIAKLALRL